MRRAPRKLGCYFWTSYLSSNIKQFFSTLNTISIWGGPDGIAWKLGVGIPWMFITPSLIGKLWKVLRKSLQIYRLKKWNVKEMSQLMVKNSMYAPRCNERDLMPNLAKKTFFPKICKKYWPTLSTSTKKRHLLFNL